MVLDSLSDRLKESLKKITNIGLVDKKAVIELSSDIKKALIAADVNITLAKEIAQKIRDRGTNETPPKGLTTREHVVNIVFEELTNFLGKEFKEIEFKKKPTKIMLVGLFGSGKTTTAGKLGRYYKKQGKKVAVVQTDTWRPAAYAQLQQLARAMKVDFYGNSSAKKPEDIIKEFEKEFKKYDVVIIDTAGRDSLNKELTDEIKVLNKAVNPDEALLVLSGDIGQGAQSQAESFHKNVGVTGVVITKLDGTAKGGGALTACATTGAKVMFIGVGEKMDAIEEFKPKNFVSRILGMGDLETLLKKAEGAIDKDKAEKLAKKVTKGQGLSLQDLYDQMEAMQKMGPLSQIMGMIPGMGGAVPKDALKGQESKMKTWKFIMQSMTPTEKENPDVMNASRINRIANGSGTDEKEVRGLLKQYKQMQKMMKSMGSPQKMKQLAKMMGGKGGLPGGMKLPGM
ncbi:signal recognition particle protein [Candidatus Woesearchaeota archaeon]|jgi:signal recognition particle subunit SRP54|nr:signal recognition particle protein [Candidatus Woesearchaeota archaeon]MBT7062564.1 signal recognition particle protein [Candidatus Woesearchaeota archaeon]MBT7402357.1 signal recognition particle protein [Candidatus Woesearchaeota archaeon]